MKSVAAISASSAIEVPMTAAAKAARRRRNAMPARPRSVAMSGDPSMGYVILRASRRDG
jgi:hypothetical protein